MAFEALLRTLAETQPGGCNAGILRPEANLLVIILSDEHDDSPQPVADYVDALAAYKGFDKLRVATIVGSMDGRAAACSPSHGEACGSHCEAPPPVGSHSPCGSSDGSCPAGEFCDRAEQRCENGASRFWSSESGRNCAWCAHYATADCCAALPSHRYVDFARAVEARVHDANPRFPIARSRGVGSRVSCLVDSICQEDFGDTLARIARELVLVHE